MSKIQIFFALCLARSCKHLYCTLENKRTSLIIILLRSNEINKNIVSKLDYAKQGLNIISHLFRKLQ